MSDAKKKAASEIIKGISGKADDTFEDVFGDVAKKGSLRKKAAIGGGAAAGGAFLTGNDDYLNTNSKPWGEMDEEEKDATMESFLPKPKVEDQGGSASGKAKISTNDPSSKDADIGATKYDEFKTQVEQPIDQAEQYGLLDDEFKKALSDANLAYQKTKDSQASKQLWEGIINGLGHIAAGVYGMKTGLNLGKQEFNRSDWDAKAQLAKNELLAARDAAKDVRAIQGQKLDQVYKRSLDGINNNQKAVDQAIQQAGNKARIQDAAKDRALRKQSEDRRQRQAMLELAMSQGDKGNVKDKVKELEKIEKRLFDLNKTFNKDSDEQTLDLMRTETERYSNLAKQLGIDEPAYAPTDLDPVSGLIFGTNDPKSEDVEKKRRTRITGDKEVVRKQYNKGLNKTKVTYSDGTQEVLDGNR